eukprot:3338816-Pyramimonas_sp.AAC.1
MIATAIGIRQVAQHCHERDLLAAQSPRRTLDTQNSIFSAPTRHATMTSKMGRAERCRSITKRPDKWHITTAQTMNVASAPISLRGLPHIRLPSTRRKSTTHSPSASQGQKRFHDGSSARSLHFKTNSL